MLLSMPYFMKNEEWYTVTYNEFGDEVYTPTEKAPPKAVESIKEYMQAFENTICGAYISPTNKPKPTQDKKRKN